MKTNRVALWVLLAGVSAFALVPAVVSAVHAPTSASLTAVGSGFSVQVQSTDHGCGYEHGPDGQSGTDGNADDNNGGGNDGDSDHDCTEQNPNT